MKKITILMLVVIYTALFINNTNAQVERRIIEEISVKSIVLDEDRPILISKPTRYEQSEEKYFVIYVLDGEINTNFTAGIAELLYQSGYGKLLVVGVVNTFRSEDLTPTAWREAPSGGGADRFLDFFKNELIPYVDSHYRTHDYKVLVGHSFGGLFSTHVLFKDPGLFDAHIAITPSVFYDDFYAGNNLKKLFEMNKNLNNSFFFSVGNEPGIEGDAVYKLNELFKSSAPISLDWKFEYYPKENHSTTPLIATMDGLKYVFRDLILDNQIVQDNGLEFVKEHYKSLKKKYKTNIKIPQRTFMDYGFQLMTDQHYSEALEVFEYYAQIYPNMIIPYDAMSDIYVKLGNKEKAIENLEKLLVVLPGFKDAVVKLNNLKQ